MELMRDFGKLMSRFFRKKESNISHRIQLLKQMPKNGICAEIGVWKGDFSKQILSETSPQTLHLIDSWSFQEEFSERMYGGAVARNQEDMNSIYQVVLNKFSGLNNVVFNKGKSSEVLRGFEDDYFDWVYIDGNHYYEYVMCDLQLCYEKVKLGGVISGDDYNWGKSDGYPVKQAVQDFVAEKNLTQNLVIIGSQFMFIK